ncbi:T9SS type A sorting domain-containing protein [Flavobacterium amniphilum]|uniref:DUF7619 domain-containing protein n=1 Tax=Flavobacterium amniphilum TaxID=1834035 RepID=UPI00202A8268|nr:T9SS type A sorting domain-containing protein [Flavobacterium amniphilum]MCL9807378.1 T9SS type A sorting domain-containing protein [Flavobacterium amniphilum]
MIKKICLLIVLFSCNAIYSQLTVTTTIQNILCSGSNDGGITINVSGGTAPYFVSLAPVALSPQVFNPNTFVFSRLPAGTYTVLVTDSDNATVTLNATILSPQPINLTHTISGLQITALVTGGTPPFTYTLISSSNGTAPVTQSFGVFVVPDPGFYDLYVYDSNGCVAVTSANISFIDLNVQNQYVDLNGDGFTSVGDVVDYQISLTNNGYSAMTNVTVSGSNAEITGSPIATLNVGATNATAYTARHVITQNDINNGYVNAGFIADADYDGSTAANQTSVLTTLNISSGIRMNAFVDTNNNGTQEAGETNVDAGTFNYHINSGPVTSVSSASGRYTVYESNPSSVYNVTYAIRPELLPRYSIVNATYNNISVPANSGITTLNFALTEMPYTDLGVNVIPYLTAPRPGFTYKNQIAYKNSGNTTIANGTLTFTHDAAVSISSVSQSGTTPIANGFTYNFTNLMPNQIRYITVDMQVPTIPTVTLGQTLTNSIASSGVAGDINAQNNSSNLTQIIVGPYDPNDKTESHGGKIVHAQFSSGDYLKYTIRFENTGNYEAVNVKVNDVLDGKLDETTVETISTSHSYVLERKNNVLNWKFDAIQLPPSVANTNIGHGYITFRVKPKAGYAIGDIIPNTASIYFDFNPPIVTDVCNTEFVNSLSTDTFSKEAFVLYPNPTNGIVNIAMNDSNVAVDSAEVMDVSGKVLFKKTVTNLNATVDLTSLANGMYFIKLKAGQQQKTIKVVKH